MVSGENSAASAAAEFQMTESDFGRAYEILRRLAGVKLDPTKQTLVYARLTKRLRALNMRRFSEYFDFVESEAGEREQIHLVSLLTTHVTKFFREPHHFEFLKNTAVPALMETARKRGRVRLWSAGCSTGEEPYTIAMSLLEVEPRIAEYDVKILATDIDPISVKTGQQGLYRTDQLGDISPERRRRFFAPGNGGTSQISDEVRSLVTFRPLNLIQQSGWPMKHPMDVVFCRNTVIYFDSPAQEIVWSRMAQTIRKGGWLMIGHSERVSETRKADFTLCGITTYQRQ